VYIKTSDFGEKIPFELESDSIDDLRKKIHEKLDIAPHECRLTFCDMELENEEAAIFFAKSFFDTFSKNFHVGVANSGGGSGGGGGVGGVGGLVFNDIRIRTRETLNCSLSANKAVVSSALHATFSTGLINREIEVTCPEFAPMGNAYNPRACVVYIQTLLATSLQNDLVVAKLKIFDNTAVLVANDVDSVFQRGIAQANGNLTEYFAPFKPVPPGSDLEKVGEK